VAVEKVNEQRLYAARCAFLQKDGLFRHFQKVYGELFGTTFDILLYDITSTYFEVFAKQSASAPWLLA